jgi:hypothetical protein
MSRFLVLLSASDPEFVASVENANGLLVSSSDTGGAIVDGDENTRATVAQLASVGATSPVDGPIDASQLQLDDATADVVAAWNRLFDPDYVAAKQERPRDGELWDTPGGCLPDASEGENVG